MRFVRYGLGVICLALGFLGVAMILGLHAYLPTAIFWAVAPILGFVIGSLAPLGLYAFPVAVGLSLLVGALLLFGPGLVLAKIAKAGMLTFAVCTPIWLVVVAGDWAWGDGFPAWMARLMAPLGVPAIAPASWPGWALGVSVAAFVVGGTLLLYLGAFLSVFVVAAILSPLGWLIPSRVLDRIAPVPTPEPSAPAPAKYWRGRRID